MRQPSCSSYISRVTAVVVIFVGICTFCTGYNVPWNNPYDGFGGRKFDRPMPHDLMVDFINNLGLSLLNVLPRLLLPAAVVVSQSNDNGNDNSKEEFTKVCKRTELPLYRTETSKSSSQKDDKSDEVGLFSDGMDEVKSKLMSLLGEVRAYQQVAKEQLNTAYHKWAELKKLLAEEENYPPKAGAITVGALTGFILGLRGGKAKRLLYSSIGALGMATLCFPKEAREYTTTGLAEAKRITKIAYGFIYGVKKDDSIELPSIKFPTSISETWDTINSFVKSSSSSPSVTDNGAIGSDIGGGGGGGELKK